MADSGYSYPGTPPHYLTSRAGGGIVGASRVYSCPTHGTVREYQSSSRRSPCAFCHVLSGEDAPVDILAPGFEAPDPANYDVLADGFDPMVRPPNADNTLNQ